MGLHRFFVPPDAIGTERAVLPAELARQARRVLRLRPGDEVIVLDDSGLERRVSLDVVEDRRVEGTIVATTASSAEPRLRVTLCQALLPREKFELVLQKGTELGVAAFVPVQTRYSLPGRDVAAKGRLDRWRRIIREAAEQSRRGRLPRLEPAITLEAALARYVAGGPAMLAWEGEHACGVQRALRDLPREGDVALFVGPEGGFAAWEVERARASGATPVSLGPRILRAETAGIVLAALALFASGDLEPAP